MDYLCIVRHGEYCDSSYDVLRELTEEGREKASELGKMIKEATMEARSHSFIVFTSPLRRARDTADEIAKEIRYDRPHGYRESLGVMFQNNVEVDELIKEHGEGERGYNLVLVSHKEICESFPSYFFKSRFGKHSDIALGRGDAVLFDMKKEQVLFLPQGEKRAFSDYFTTEEFCGICDKKDECGKGDKEIHAKERYCPDDIVEGTSVELRDEGLYVGDRHYEMRKAWVEERKTASEELDSDKINAELETARIEDEDQMDFFSDLGMCE